MIKALGVFFIIAGMFTAGLFVWKISTDPTDDGLYIISPSIFMSGIFMIFCFAMGIIMLSSTKEQNQELCMECVGFSYGRLHCGKIKGHEGEHGGIWCKGCTD